jgi:arginyl-tRNA synthetase
MAVRQQDIISAVQSVLIRMGLTDGVPIALERPANPDHGDFSTNVALVNFSQIKKTVSVNNPFDLAVRIQKELSKDKAFARVVKSVEAVRPGFINFKLPVATFTDVIERVCNEGDAFGAPEIKKKKTLIIDYSSPNIAKRFSIGHLRSTIIGNTIARLYTFLGWTAIGDNHIGDWGTQFGKMIVAIRKWAKKDVSKLSIQELEELYIKFHAEAEKDPTLEDDARLVFKKLEEGSEDERRLWRQLIDQSMKEFNGIYKLLDVRIEEAIGESFYEHIMLEVIADARKKKLAVMSEGALVIKFPKDVYPPALLLKSDGATTYFTRDLATIKYRMSRWNPDLIVYEVGEEQSLHFRQLFRVAEMMGYGSQDKFVHVAHGMVRLKEGRMSTRKGKSIKLEEVLDKAIAKAGKISSDKKIAEMVGIGAVKYNDLKRFPSDGYVFDWEEALNLNGNSGPYLQYTFVRCKSILEKTDKKINLAGIDYTYNEEELGVLREIVRFEEVLTDAAARFAPNVLCNYLFELCQNYNSFYVKHQVINAENNGALMIRLGMTKAVMQILATGLGILGIQTPDRM